MLKRFIMQESVEQLDKKQIITTRKYLHFNIEISELYQAEGEDRQIITMEFGDMEETIINDQELASHGGTKKRFSFSLPPLQNPDDIYSFVNILHCGINNTLSALYERKTNEQDCEKDKTS